MTTTKGRMPKQQQQQHNLDKQMGAGCMSGLFHIFDRPYSAKRLPSSSSSSLVTETTSETISISAISQVSQELPNPKTPPNPDQLRSVPLQTPPIFISKEGGNGPGNKTSWKYSKDTPRLSLDSRATTDSKGSLHPKDIRTTSSLMNVNRSASSISTTTTTTSDESRSPSVIARLMGLEPLPNNKNNSPDNKPELRRSSSESRVSRDLFHSRLITVDCNNDNLSSFGNRTTKQQQQQQRKVEQVVPNKGMNRRKTFLDKGDIFPDPKRNVSVAVSVYGEIGNRLKMKRDFEEPSKDLEALREILQGLQLKGLLHSRKVSESVRVGNRNFVYDESPIVVMKPSRLSNSTVNNRSDYSPSKSGNQVRRSFSTAGEVSPRTGRSSSQKIARESNMNERRSNSLVKPKALNVETQRRVSSVNSPKVISPRRNGPDSTVNNKSPRTKKGTALINRKEKVVAAEDESGSSISGSSITTTSNDTERPKTEELKEGRSILERCDKLLNSIAEMNAADAQPSPVSVLDSSFYRDESLTPSPITTKRNVDFKDIAFELEYESWSPMVSPIRSKPEEISSQHCDYEYISDILRASRYLPEDSDVFLLLEKQQYLKGKDTSKVSRSQRKLIFDIINEILDGYKRLPPWKKANQKPSLDRVWSEFSRLRERESTDDLFESIRGVLEKDLAGEKINGCDDCPVEMSEAILDIERMIFKDLISDTIRDLAELSSRSTVSSIIPRRKLVF